MLGLFGAFGGERRVARPLILFVCSMYSPSTPNPIALPAHSNPTSWAYNSTLRINSALASLAAVQIVILGGMAASASPNRSLLPYAAAPLPDF